MSVIRHLSVSQVESFDPRQNGGCERRWWFDRVHGLKPDQDDAQGDGEAGHALLANYLGGHGLPKGRVKMGKAVTGAILKGDLPAPGPDLFIEDRFDGQAKLDVNGNWIPLDTSQTLWLGGVPWEGFIDLAFRRSAIPEIWDHKFSSDPDTYAKKGRDLIKTVQMPVYVLAMLPQWPDARTWRLVHHNVSRKGVHSFLSSDVVHLDDVLARKSDVEATVARMHVVAGATAQDDVPFNRRSCRTWSGCPHQSICRAFQENQMQLTEAEKAMFEGLGDAPAAPVPVTGSAALPPPPGNTFTPEELALAAQLEIEPFDAREILAKKAKKAALSAPPPVPPPAKTPPRPRLAIDDSKNPAGNAPTCVGCGVALTAENASRLSSGLWLHIGCPKKETAPAPIVPPDAPASVPALASEQPKAPAEPTAARKPRAPRAVADAAPTLTTPPSPAVLASAPTIAAHAGGVSITLQFPSIAEALAYLAR